MEELRIHHTDMLLNEVSAETNRRHRAPTYLKADLEINRPVRCNCLRGRGRTPVPHRQPEVAERSPGAARLGTVGCSSTMVEVARNRDKGDHSEQEATCPEEMLRHHRSMLPSGIRVKSNGRSGGGERKSSSDRRNRRHDRSTGLGDRGRREGRLYCSSMSASV